MSFWAAKRHELCLENRATSYAQAVSLKEMKIIVTGSSSTLQGPSKPIVILLGSRVSRLLREIWILILLKSWDGLKILLELIFVRFLIYKMLESSIWSTIRLI